MTGIGPPGNARWSHVALNCRDLDATEAFYTRWFGFRRVRVYDDGDIRAITIRNGDALLELFAVPAPSGSSGPPGPSGPPAGDDGPHEPGLIRHLALQVDDVDGFLAGAVGELPIRLGPLSFEDEIPGWRTVFVTDPDGVVVEVSQGYVDQSPAEPARDAYARSAPGRPREHA